MNTLQNRVTEQGKTLSAQGDSLTKLSNSLSQTAADIDASGKMPGNLIVNGSFERGAAGFTGWSSTATVADLQVPHSGNKALKMSAGQSNWSDRKSVSRRAVPTAWGYGRSRTRDHD